MRWRSRLAVLATSLLLGASIAAAQSPAVESDARLASVRGRLDAALEAARRGGLPEEWLRAKIAEGLSKRVPPPLIAAAVEALGQRMRAADAMVRDLGPARGRRPLLRAAVDALSARAPEARVRGLIAQVRERGGGAPEVRGALVTVAELAERGFSGEAAVEAAAEAHRRGGSRGLGELTRRARGIRDDVPGGRDRALRGLGRAVGAARGVDARRGGGDHGGRGRGPR